MTSPPKADLIFVFAGRESRKRFGVELYREGVAPRLILSVGRFEWRRFPALGLPGDGGLVEKVQAIEPSKRHFFVDVSPDRARCEHVRRGRLGTWSEARALARVADSERIENLLIVSGRLHLRRCLVSLRTLLPSFTTVYAVPSPEEETSGRQLEAAKLLAYAVIAGLRSFRIPDIKCSFTLSQPGLREGTSSTDDTGPAAPTPSGASNAR
jgi:uncharacterized SAM-binding protein YcdF (DUF218 family)